MDLSISIARSTSWSLFLLLLYRKNTGSLKRSHRHTVSATLYTDILLALYFPVVWLMLSGVTQGEVNSAVVVFKHIAMLTP